MAGADDVGLWLEGGGEPRFASFFESSATQNNQLRTGADKGNLTV